MFNCLNRKIIYNVRYSKTVKLFFSQSINIKSEADSGL